MLAVCWCSVSVLLLLAVCWCSVSVVVVVACSVLLLWVCCWCLQCVVCSVSVLLLVVCCWCCVLLLASCCCLQCLGVVSVLLLLAVFCCCECVVVACSASSAVRLPAWTVSVALTNHSTGVPRPEAPRSTKKRATPIAKSADRRSLTPACKCMQPHLVAYLCRARRCCTNAVWAGWLCLCYVVINLEACALHQFASHPKTES